MTLKLAKPTGASLKLAKPTGAKLLTRSVWQPMDADAAAYITAVETADGQALEEKTKIAIDNFVLGCKADGIWAAIKASCILAGARTLSGALVPLVGTAPTNFNFVAGDYSRKTGLLGDGSTKYLNSNRRNNADPQDNKHIAAYVTTVGPALSSRTYIGTNIQGISDSIIITSATTGRVGFRLNSAATATADSANNAGLLAASRSSSSEYVFRTTRVNTSFASISVAPSSAFIGVFAAGNGSVYVAARQAFYSIGEAIDLALLDARVTDLINAFGDAIP